MSNVAEVRRHSTPVAFGTILFFGLVDTLFSGLALALGAPPKDAALIAAPGLVVGGVGAWGVLRDNDTVWKPPSTP